MNKFKCNDIVRFIQDNKDYLVIRVYKGNDGGYKYDVSSIDGKQLIIAMPESVLELK